MSSIDSVDATEAAQIAGCWRRLGASELGRVHFRACELTHGGEMNLHKSGRSEAAELTFSALNTMFDDYRVHFRTPGPGRWERWSLWAGLAGAAVALTVGLLFEGSLALYVVLAGLVVELSGLGLSVLLGLIRDWQSLRHPQRELARDLDHDFDLWSGYVANIRKFPIIDRERLLRYVRDRRSVMASRTGLLVGGVERLGILPLLLALYLQFKGWEWGDWEALADVNLVQGLLIFALVLVYLVGWRLIGLRARVEGIEQLLTEASARDREG